MYLRARIAPSWRTSKAPAAIAGVDLRLLSPYRPRRPGIDIFAGGAPAYARPCAKAVCSARAAFSSWPYITALARSAGDSCLLWAAGEIVTSINGRTQNGAKTVLASGACGLVRHPLQRPLGGPRRPRTRRSPRSRPTVV